VSTFRRFQAIGGLCLRLPGWIYNTQGAGQSCGPQPDQTAHARSRAARAVIIESRVVDRIQSAAEGSQLPFQRTSGGSKTSIYQVHTGRAVVVFLLRGYKFLISPLLPSACRFYPTCSEYMREAVEVHGVGKGFWLGLKRLGRCHPFHAGGADPVPR
jgi:uncharacterized protein